MHMKHTLLIGALVFGLLAGTGLAHADNSITFPVEKWDQAMLRHLAEGPRYLPKDFNTKVEPPPANDSAETRKDLDAMLEMQAHERTPEQLKSIDNENKNDLYKIMMDQTQFADPSAYPKLYMFRNVLVDEVVIFIIRDKKKFNRARPTQLEPRLTTVIPVPPHASYPSGHAAQSWAVAQVLSMVDPGNHDKYTKMATDIAHRREIAGVHYPSDSAAARVLVKNVLLGMMMNPKFAAMRDAALAEVYAAKKQKGR